MSQEEREAFMAMVNLLLGLAGYHQAKTRAVGDWNNAAWLEDSRMRLQKAMEIAFPDEHNK